jgi:hypothetical protein
LCLLEHPQRGTRFAAATAFWINQRSRTWSAVRNGRAADADLVWVLSQDPLGPAARAWLRARIPPGVPVLNPPEVHDAYHAADAFPRLAAAGVRVPRTTFDASDVGRTPCCTSPWACRAARSGRSTAARAPATGRSRSRTAAVPTGGTAATGRSCWATWCCPRTSSWPTCRRRAPARSWPWSAPSPSTAHERAQLLLLTRTLGLQFCGVDFLRRRTDGMPVFLDVNAYPTVVGAWSGDMPAGDRGQWHVFDNAARLGLPEPGGRPVWEQVDDALLALAAAPAREAVRAA